MIIKYIGGDEHIGYGLKFGEELFVVGMCISNDNLHYLFNSGRVIQLCPYDLFKIIDHRLPRGWYFNSFTKDDREYPYTQALWGYHEWCFDGQHYEDLVEMEEAAHAIFYKRKVELEQSLPALKLP